jgi:hypothetical protein
MQTATLSESAVAVLRFRVKGWRWKVHDRNRAAFQELVAAGIMEPLGEDFRFTDEGWERRGEILAAEEDRIERERYEPPDASSLSKAARGLLRTCIVKGYPTGDETNRPAYRELVKARIMIPMGSFTQGDECLFRFTYWGWRRRFEFAELDCAKDDPCSHV